MQFIDFQNHKVAYYLSGTRDFPLVFLHGFCEDSNMWTDFIERFEETYQIIRVDLPGFGKSAVLPNPSIRQKAEAVLAVLEHLDINEFLLVGHSMGGYTALEIARQAGERIKGLTMFHSHPYADSDAKRVDRDRALEFIHTNGPQLYVKQFIPALFTDRFAKSHTFLVDKMILRASRFSSAGITGGLTAMKARPDNAEVLKNAPFPVQFIIGEKDQAIPLKISLEQTHLPAVADIQIYPKVAHMGMFEAHKETQSALQKFCAFCLEKMQT